MMQNTQQTQNPPPILKRWSRLYVLVIVNLAFWLFLFYLLRRIFE